MNNKFVLHSCILLVISIKYEKIHTPLGPVSISEPRTPRQCCPPHSLFSLNQNLFVKCCGFRIKTGQWTRGNKLVTSQGQFSNNGCDYKDGYCHRFSVRATENQIKSGLFSRTKCRHKARTDTGKTQSHNVQPKPARRKFYLATLRLR